MTDLTADLNAIVAEMRSWSSGRGNGPPPCVVDWADRLEAHRAALPGMAGDAARYRWLRERIAGPEHIEDEFIDHPGYQDSAAMAPEIDAAIDAALQAEQASQQGEGNDR